MILFTLLVIGIILLIPVMVMGGFVIILPILDIIVFIVIIVLIVKLFKKIFRK